MLICVWFDLFWLLGAQRQKEGQFTAYGSSLLFFAIVSFDITCTCLLSSLTFFLLDLQNGTFYRF